MEEKGLGVYNYFKTKGIKGTAREIAKSLVKIRNKRERKKKLDEADSTLFKITKELALELGTTRSWLEFLSVPQTIRTLELSRPEDEQQQTIIARLSTMGLYPL